MPKAPRGEKRPADVIGTAVKDMRIATGEEEDVLKAFKNAAVELKGPRGRTRATKLRKKKKRPDMARKAAPPCE
jgi:hypothetical protein